VCAAFVASATGPHLRCGKDATTSSQLVAMTDRRLIKAVAWWPGEDLSEGVGAMWDWQAGSPITRGYFTRRLIWLGQIRGGPRAAGRVPHG
jgi:hypothetical protein